MRTLARSLAPLFATAFLLLVACDKKAEDKKVDNKVADKKVDDKKADDKQVEAPQPEAPKPATVAVLTLGAAKIMEKGKPEEALELRTDGTLQVGPNPDMTLKISSDGKISKADGTVVAQVGADGVLTFGDKPSGAVVSDTGLTMTEPDGKTGTAKFLADGTIAVDPAPADNLLMVAEGCTGPMVKTCAVMLTMLLFMPGEPSEATAAVEAGPEPKVIEPKQP